MIRLASILAALAALSACSGYDDDEPVEAVSQSEAEALDDAAAMIEERRLPEGVFDAEGDDASADPAMPADDTPRETGGPQPMELPDE
ncbi:hypothetical protein [Qipengyuania qiaonensis]|uniref:Secreted protein n=1 Tax=Qipengyuania qiaonensis TaxID=2867240 RepID=A0ABS7J6U8_9SPHN|nr:hypothetical protein [Qipengyuania qiaonensis]MBX7481819.1 hypothetical protein [Qipengyuania qiaonensis]